jgi:hypothetical protein
MKEKILQLIINSPISAVRLITQNCEMWNWVLKNCDNNCIDSKSKIYTAITGEKVFCPCGSGKRRKLISLSKGFQFCGRASVCNAARQSVSDNCKKAAALCDKKIAAAKRAKTNLLKYGVENVGQSAQAKAARAITYGNSEKVKQIKNKMQNTCQQRYNAKNPMQNIKIHQKQIKTLMNTYGVEYPIQLQLFKDKMQKTNITRYGVPYVSQNAEIAKQIVMSKKNSMMNKFGRLHETQLHISNESWNILHDDNKFASMLSKYGRTEMANKLGVSVNLISVYHYNFGLKILHGNISSPEIEISNWLNSLNIISKKDKTICDGKELDIYMPEYNLAIEHDGLFWHSEGRGKNKYYHFNKTIACANKNIELIHIFGDEWINSQNVCKSIIKQRLHLGVRIAGRKCKVVEVKNIILKNFLNENHLQGWVNGSRAFVLKYNNEIVAAMTFGKPRYNKNFEWELLRLAYKNDIVVMGGSQKLWAFTLQQLQPTSIVSYCDRRWFTGKVYEKLGFTLKSKGKPTYWYTDYVSRFHRSRFIKSKAIKAALDMDNSLYTINNLNIMTEKEITKNILGLDRIWDCGQDTWVWKKQV